jgi:hypothetical protein
MRARIACSIPRLKRRFWGVAYGAVDIAGSRGEWAGVFRDDRGLEPHLDNYVIVGPPLLNGAAWPLASPQWAEDPAAAAAAATVDTEWDAGSRGGSLGTCCLPRKGHGFGWWEVEDVFCLNIAGLALRGDMSQPKSLKLREPQEHLERVKRRWSIVT